MIRRDFLKQTAGAAAVAGMAALSPMAGSALAQDQQTAAATPITHSVLLKDMTADDERFVNRMAAVVSKDAIVIVYYGSNPVLIDAVRAGASKAKNDGYPVRGMIQAQGDESTRIYANGLPMAESVRVLSTDIESEIQATIRNVHQKMKKLQTSLSTEQAPAVSAN